MRSISLILFFLIPCLCFAQSEYVVELNRATAHTFDESNINSIVYGEFFMRPEEHRKHYQKQILCLYEVERKTYYSFTPDGKGRKKGVSKTFCIAIPPGKYVVWGITYDIKETGMSYPRYEWMFGHIFADTIFTQKTHKEELEPDMVKHANLERFRFNIEPASMYYLGTWHFETPKVSFSNDKNSLDSMLKARMDDLFVDYKNAKVEIPH